MVQNGVNDQHVRELQGDARVGYGRTQATAQVRGSLGPELRLSCVRTHVPDREPGQR